MSTYQILRERPDSTEDVYYFATRKAAVDEFLERREAKQMVYLRDSNGVVLFAYHDDCGELEAKADDGCDSFPNEEAGIERLRGIEP